MFISSVVVFVFREETTTTTSTNKNKVRLGWDLSGFELLCVLMLLSSESDMNTTKMETLFIQTSSNVVSDASQSSET